MTRYFNTAGPCVPGKHYLLPSLNRAPEVQRLIDEQRFFVVHAARQTGKTTLLLALAKELESQGTYRAVYVTVESAHRLDEAERGIPALISIMETMLAYLPWVPKPFPLFQEVDIFQRLQRLLSWLTTVADRPLVILLDEADCLSGQTLLSVLRQLRQGYVTRSQQPFPQSIALVGMRDIRDYKAIIRPGSETLGSASPFNVVSKSVTIDNFSRADVASLYGQHAEDTGQVFPDAVIDLIWEQTRGQPWLVNAIAREIVEEKLSRDYAKLITVAITREAIQALILRRDTHLDSLIERLREDRVRRIVESVFLGEEHAIDMIEDDVRYCLDLGLLRNDKGVVRPACPIYAEVISRVLSWSSQCALPEELEHRWMTKTSMDMDGLLQGFQQFWRENGDLWTGRYAYAEAAPHLILMAFLQRVLNGGALVTREFASGRKRLDIDVFYAGKHYPIELKLWRGPKSRQEGLDQLAAYCSTLGCDEGWLVLFDRRPERTWEQRITWEQIEHQGKKLRLAGG